MSVLDTFVFNLKVGQNDVSAKLDDVNKKVEKVSDATGAVNDGFKAIGNEFANTLGKVIPGSDKLLGNLQKIYGVSHKIATAGGAAGGGSGVFSRLRLRGSPPAGGGPGVAGGAGGAGGGAGGVAAGAAPSGAATAASTAQLVALGAAAGVVVAALMVLAGGAAILTKAYMDGVKSLSDSRKAATEAGVTNTQMAATEQFAKSMRLSKEDARDALKEIAQKTQEGWVKSRERGNIFGVGNEQTQMLKKHGIRTSDGNGELRNSTAIFEDIGKKMKTMSRDSAIAFGEFFGMTKDFAAGVYDSKQSLSEFAQANKESIAAQAEAMAASKNYEKAQQALANAWDDFSIAVGGKVLPVVTDMLETLVDAIPDIVLFGEAVYGQIQMIKDTASAVFDWLKSKADAVTDFLFGAGSGDAVRTAISDGVSGAASAAADAFKRGMEKSAEYGKRGDKPTDQAAFDREMNKQTSLNAKAANVQLEAANLMKTATAKFGLSTEQYMAMWAATSGKASGLRDTGGTTTSDFRDIYKQTQSQYATAEGAVALYGKGQPMMQQLPQQYAMGMGANPYLPSNPKGLGRAQEAVQATSAPVGPAASPFGGSGTRGGRGATTNEVNVGDVHVTVNTKSTDPEEINSAVSSGMVGQLKFAMNKLGTGEL